MNKKILEKTDINTLIESHMPFIINTVSKLTNKYVSIENDEELSVAIIAFDEAVKKYSDDRGPFLPFAKLVITSRLKNYFKKENRKHIYISLETLEEEGIQISDELVNPIDDKSLLIEEIDKLKTEINLFGFTLEDLVDEAPKHSDTRKRAIDLSHNVSQDEALTDFMYEKKRLPIKQISLKYTVTEKIIKGSKKFITTGVIIFYKNFRNLKLWIKGR